MTETWLKPFHKDSFIIDALHYNILRYDRVNESYERGGGVAVIFKKHLSNKICKVDVDANKYVKDPTCTNGFEVLAFDYYKNKSVFSRFVCIYLPPNNAKNPKIVSAMIQLLKDLICHCDFYLLGDFNFSDITWTQSQVFAKRQTSLDFLSLLSTYNLSQLVTDSTHDAGKALDLVITSNTCKVESVEIREPLTRTNDHNMIEINLHTSTPKEPYTRKRNFFSADYPSINNFLSNINWINVLPKTDDIDSLYTKILSVINEAISRYVPLSKRKQKSRLPSHLRYLLQQKKHYYKRSKSDPSAKSTYKKYEKQYKKEIKQHMRHLEEKVISSRNRNGLYSYINRKLHTPSSIPPLKKDGAIIIDANHKANLFNDCFTDVFIKDNNVTPSLLNSTNSNPISQMPDIFITPTDIRKAISNLKNHASRTPEDIPAIFVKNTAEHLIYPLTILFNHSLKLGKVPHHWKEAIIIPIHKKGSKNNPLNYRPISLTSIFCRILERIIHTKVMTHISCYDLLSHTQHGFVAKRSTLSQHIELLDKLTDNYDKNTQIHMIYLDFSKAFDRVSHPKLLHVLSNFKLSIKLVEWIRDYLTGRKQRTIVENDKSEYKNISSGVPQGSVLGPLMFLMFIDDLLKTLSNNCSFTKIYAFADDVKLMSKKPTDIQKGLKIVEKWAENWQLTIQPEKSEHIIFSRTHQHTQHIYTINGNPIKRTNSVKDLGISITENLDWNLYLQQIKSKSDRLTYTILRTFKTHNLDTYKVAFKTYIRPILEYNTSAWTPYKKSDIIIVESIQRAYTKKVCQRLNLKFNNYLERLSIMGMKTLEYRRLEFDLVLLYKIIHNLILLDLKGSISRSTSTYNLRRHSFHLDYNFTCNTQIRRQFFHLKTISVWNKLPEHLVSSQNLELFKIRLHNFNLRSVFKFYF